MSLYLPGADGLRPHGRALLGVRGPRRATRHRYDGQGDRQRVPARGRRHHAADRRGADAGAALQHVRREPGGVRGGAGRTGRHGGGAHAAQRPGGGHLLPARAGQAAGPVPLRGRCARQGAHDRRGDGQRPRHQGAHEQQALHRRLGGLQEHGRALRPGGTQRKRKH